MHGALVYVGEASTKSFRIQMPVGHYWSSVGIQKLHFHPMAELTVFTGFQRLQFRFMIIKSLKEFRRTSARTTVFTGKGGVKSQKEQQKKTMCCFCLQGPGQKGLGGHKPILSPNPIHSVKREYSGSGEREKGQRKVLYAHQGGAAGLSSDSWLILLPLPPKRQDYRKQPSLPNKIRFSEEEKERHQGHKTLLLFCSKFANLIMNNIK